MKNCKDKTFRNSVILIIAFQIAIIMIAIFAVPLLRKPDIDSNNFNVQTINLRAILFTFALIKLSSIIIIIAMPLKYRMEDGKTDYIEFEQPKPIISALLYLYTFLWFVICTFIAHMSAVEIIVFNSLFTTFIHFAIIIKINKKRMKLTFDKNILIIAIESFSVLFIVTTVLSILKLLDLINTESNVIGGIVLYVIFFIQVAAIWVYEKKIRKNRDNV